MWPNRLPLSKRWIEGDHVHLKSLQGEKKDEGSEDEEECKQIVSHDLEGARGPRRRGKASSFVLPQALRVSHHHILHAEIFIPFPH